MRPGIEAANQIAEHSGTRNHLRGVQGLVKSQAFLTAFFQGFFGGGAGLRGANLKES